MPPHAIQLQAVNKWFGTVHAVRDLDLEIPRGCLCGFLGPNGAGKSTTIRIILSIIYQDQGTVRVQGSSALDAKDTIGYLPEERGLYRRMQVGDFLAYIGLLKGVPRSTISERVEMWLDRIQLADSLRSRCNELSKGMQQKVQFAAAVINDPDLIILDEPFAGLDPVNADLVRGLIRDLHREGKTILFSTHVLHQAEQICDRIVLINRGAKLLDSSLADIRSEFDPRVIEIHTAVAGQNPETLDGVDAITQTGDHTWELHLKNGTDPGMVMQALVQRIPLTTITLRRPSLEEIFVALVTQNDQDMSRAGEEALDAG